MTTSTPKLQRVATSRPALCDTAALVLDPEVVEEVAEKYDGTPLGYCAAKWLYTYSAALDLGFSEDTARRQAAAAWDASVEVARA